MSSFDNKVKSIGPNMSPDENQYGLEQTGQKEADTSQLLTSVASALTDQNPFGSVKEKPQSLSSRSDGWQEESKLRKRRLLSEDEEDSEKDEDDEESEIEEQDDEKFTNKTKRRKTSNVQDGQTLRFPVKLMIILDDGKFNDVISWNPDGLAFSIHKPDELVEKVFPAYFKKEVVKFSSLTRKLHRWGFVKIIRDRNLSAFSHMYFKRGEVALCEAMRCSKKNGLHESYFVSRQYQLQEQLLQSNQAMIREQQRMDDLQKQIQLYGSSQQLLMNRPTHSLYDEGLTSSSSATTGMIHSGNSLTENLMQPEMLFQNNDYLRSLAASSYVYQNSNPFNLISTLNNNHNQLASQHILPSLHVGNTPQFINTSLYQRHSDISTVVSALNIQQQLASGISPSRLKFGRRPFSQHQF